MIGSKLSITSIRVKFNQLLRRLRRYSSLMFISFVALLYLLLVFRIQGLDQPQPADVTADSQAKTAHVLRVDPSVVKQLQSLRDNSVSVQALFNEARENPFQ